MQLNDSDIIYIPPDPFSDPFIPFDFLNYLELNNIFSSHKNSFVDSLESFSQTQTSPEKVNENLSTTKVSVHKSQDLHFESWDELGKIVQTFMNYRNFHKIQPMKSLQAHFFQNAHNNHPKSLISQEVKNPKVKWPHFIPKLLLYLASPFTNQILLGN